VQENYNVQKFNQEKKPILSDEILDSKHMHTGAR